LLADKINVWAGNKTGDKGVRRQDGSFKRKAIVPVKEKGIRSNIWRYHTGNNGDDYTGHPAVFPEALARDHILSWSNKGDTVLDPMCGSGTTGKMAVLYQRNFIGIDISAEYIAIAEKRIRQAQQQLLLPIFDTPGSASR
jgi:site-specific DNA-methyltransferase (adenine-specific)